MLPLLWLWHQCGGAESPSRWRLFFLGRFFCTCEHIITIMSVVSLRNFFNSANDKPHLLDIAIFDKLETDFLNRRVGRSLSRSWINILCFLDSATS